MTTPADHARHAHDKVRLAAERLEERLQWISPRAHIAVASRTLLDAIKADTIARAQELAARR